MSTKPITPYTVPLFVANTSGATPFAHFLHEGDVGNTLILGPTGAGKSLLLAFLALSFLRYPRSQVFYFDLGLSSYVAANAAGAEYHELTADADGAHGFAPLAQLDTMADRLRANQFVELLLRLQGVNPGPTGRREIHRAVELLAGSSTRTLSALNPQSKEIREALAYYTVDGPLGTLLDSEVDTVRHGRFVVYEYLDLMSRSEVVALPVLVHLFSLIARRLDGRPTLVLLDEAWRALLHDAFRDQMIEWLKTFRKANASLVFATQELTDLFASGRSETILNSCPTRILLPNPNARDPEAASGYRRIGLSDRQLELLAQAAPKRDYYAVCPSGRRFFDLDIGPVAKAFLGASRPEDIRRARELIAAEGAKWPARWLHDQGLESEAKRWLELREEMC
jgi:type IV secretion system protein VirB4